MSTQQDIYAAGSESRPPMLNKENYVPWSSRLLRYAKSRPNGKLIHNSILNRPYVRKMISEPGDANHDITVTETFHLQTDDELFDKELKQIEADDQAIQTILLGLPEDIYAAKAKLFNEWERFTSNEGESIESYYHHFLKLMNDLKRNKHFPEKITKDLHTTDYTQLYDFLKYNQKEVDELKAERLTKTQDPLALMANSNNPYAFPAPHQDQSSFNQNYLQQPMTNPEDITDPTTAMNMTLTLMTKAFKLNYSTPTNNNQRILSNPRNRQIAQPGMNMGQDRQMQIVRGNSGNKFRQYAWQNAKNPAGYNDVIGNQVIQNAVQNPRVQNVGNQNGLIGVQGNGNQNGHYARNCTARPRRRDAAYLQTQLLIAQKEEARIQLQAEEYDLMAAAVDLDEIEKVNANCILMANLQQASTSGTQTDSAPVYDTDGSAEVHENCDDNEIFNMFTQEGHYIELLESIPESHQVPQHDNDVISEDISVEQGGETVEQHPANFEETRALYESLYQNLAIEVEKVNSVNRKLKETNADITTELARFKNQERCFEISQEKYEKPERCYQQPVYQEQCLFKKINALHLSTGNLNGYNEVQNVENQVAQNPRVQNIGNQNGLIDVQGNGIQNQIGNGNLVAARVEGNTAGQNANQIRGLGHYARNCAARPRRRDAAYLQTQLLIAQKEEARIQLQAEEYDLMAAAADLDEIEEVNANCILMANLQQASSSGTQTDSAPVYDSYGSVVDNLQQASISNTQTDSAPIYDSNGSVE
nr:hypothetical protein [Tanacetum cinerariifolium]